MLRNILTYFNLEFVKGGQYAQEYCQKYQPKGGQYAQEYSTC